MWGSHKSAGFLIQTTRRCRTEIQFVRHGLFQKCNKESRLGIFGNSEKDLPADFRVRRGMEIRKPGSTLGRPVGEQLGSKVFLAKSGTLKLTFNLAFVESRPNNFRLP